MHQTPVSRIDEALQKTDNNLFFELLNYTPEVVLVYNAQGKLVFINQRACQQLGLGSESCHNLNAWDLEPSLQGEKGWADRKQLLTEESFIQFASEYVVDSSDEPIPVEVNFKCFECNEGKLFIASSRSIQKRLKAERELARSREMLEMTGRLARVGGWDMDVVKGQVHWNQMTKAIHEVPEDYEPDFETAINFYKEGESRNTMIAGMTAAIQGGEDLGEVEVQLVTAKGKTLWVRVVGDVERDESGKVIRAYGSFQDIHERKLTEIELTESYRLLEQLTGNVPGVVYQLKMNPAGEVSYPFISSGLRRLFASRNRNEDETETLGEVLDEVIYKADTQVVYNAIQKSAETLEPFRVEFRPTDGYETRWIESTARPEREPDGSTVWYGFMQDISERKKRRAELQRFVEVTAEQNKRLLNFTYVVSHNIRSHVANLKGILEILKANEQEVRDTFVPLMEQSVDNLDESIRNLNDIVNIQAKVSLSQKTIALNESVEKTLLNLRLAAQDAGVSVENRVEKNFKLKTNPAYIDSILLNLISNAIKYSSKERKPSIVVSAEKTGNEILIEVVDNGIGIDMNKYRELVFGMYKTFHHNRDAKGLGLFITKTQVEALGGRIELESEVNVGTTVRVYLYE